MDGIALFLHVRCGYFHNLFQCIFSKARANQPVHWFLGGKGVGIQQDTSVWVSSPKSFLDYNRSRPYVQMHLYVVKLTACLDPVTSNIWYTNFVNEAEVLTHDYIFISKGGGLAYCKLYKWIWRTCHGLQYGVILFNHAFVEFVHVTQD